MLKMMCVNILYNVLEICSFNLNDLFNIIGTFENEIVSWKLTIHFKLFSNPIGLNSICCEKQTVRCKINQNCNLLNV